MTTAPVPHDPGQKPVLLPAWLVEEIEERSGAAAAIISEAAEQWLAMAKLREVIADDRAHGDIPDEVRQWGERVWRETA